MKCDRCSGDMREGIALNSSVEENTLGMYCPANSKTIGFIPVMKCQECGRSLNEREIRNRGAQ